MTIRTRFRIKTTTTHAKETTDMSSILPSETIDAYNRNNLSCSAGIYIISNMTLKMYKMV